jgi:cell division protein FtsQ
MPSILDRLKPGAAAKKKQGTKKRKPVKRSAAGATRKKTAEVKQERPPSIWFNRVLVLFAGVVVITAAVESYRTLQAIPVKRITVTGQLEHTQAEEVQNLVQGSLAGGFLSADLEGMRTELELLPWIFEANVRRRWPSTLEIHVVEQLPIARWGENAFLNHEGDIFRSEKSAQWAHLPILNGPDGSAPALMAKYLRLLEILEPQHLKIEQLAVDERGQVEAVLNGGIRLAIGTQDFLERMQRFVVIYRDELAPKAETIERIDLRYPSGLAIAFKEQESSQVAGL